MTAPSSPGFVSRMMRGAATALFLAFTLALIFMKGDGDSIVVGTPMSAVFNQGMSICDGELRPCSRPAGAVAAKIAKEAVEVILAPMYWGMSRAPEAWTPWPVPETAPMMRDVVIPFVAYALFVTACLWPFLIAAREHFPPLAAPIFILAVFGALWGWHPRITYWFFEFGALFADWPRSYYLFAQHPIFLYDFLAVAFVSLSILAATRPRPLRWWQMAVFAAVAQLTIEHMGMVVGVTLAAGAVWRDGSRWAPRLRGAFTRLGITGTAAMLAAGVAIVHFYAQGQHTKLETSGKGIHGLMTEILPTNLAWFKVVLANFISMAVLGAMGGVVAGVVAGFTGPKTPPPVSLAWASMGCLAAYVVSMLLGLFFLAYPSEMGRQFAPMAVAACFAGAALGEMAVRMLRSRFKL